MSFFSFSYCSVLRYYFCDLFRSCLMKMYNNLTIDLFSVNFNVGHKSWNELLKNDSYFG